MKLALAILAASPLFAACSDDACGIGGAPATGIVAAGGTVSVTFDPVSGSPNNDCPATDAPAGVTSLTISTPIGAPTILTLCVARPDLLDGGQPLGNVAKVGVQVVDVSGTAAGCTLVVDHTAAITGTATSAGLCNAGTDHAGFALTLDGMLTLKRTCAGVVDSVAVTLTGRAAVTGP
jgi:hypothetical protein